MCNQVAKYATLEIHEFKSVLPYPSTALSKSSMNAVAVANEHMGSSLNQGPVSGPKSRVPPLEKGP